MYGNSKGTLCTFGGTMLRPCKCNQAPIYRELETLKAQQEALVWEQQQQQRGQPAQQQQQAGAQQQQQDGDKYSKLNVMLRSKRLRLGPITLSREPGVSSSFAAYRAVTGLLQGVLPKEAFNIEVLDPMVFPMKGPNAGKHVVTFSVASSTQADVILRAKNVFRTRRQITVGVELSQQESANKLRINADPRFQAAIDPIIASRQPDSPVPKFGSIIWDLDRCVVLTKGSRTVWSVEYLEQLDQQDLPQPPATQPAAAAAGAAAAGAAAAGAAATAAAAPTGTGAGARPAAGPRGQQQQQQQQQQQAAGPSYANAAAAR
jgi:hypothetical protein